MRKPGSEKGVTIIEFLIAAIITAVMVIAGVAFIASFTRRVAASTEVSDLEEERGALSDIMKSDFDGAGRNLTRPQAPGAGTEQAQFTTNSDYLSGAGSATKIGQTGWTTPESGSRGLGSGSGSVTFTPPGQGSSIGFGGSGQWFGLTIGFGGWMGVYENGVEVAATCCYGPSQTVPVHSAGVSYTISVEAKTSGAPGQVMRLYRVVGGSSSLIWTANMAVPPYPLGFLSYLYYQNDSITNVSITGAPIVTLSGGNTELSLMPLDQGARLTKPIIVSPDGQSATMLAGDSSTDVAYSTASFTSNVGGGVLALRFPQRGTLLTGDVIDLIDFPAGRACLYRITQVNNSSPTASITISPVDSSQPAWGRLSSAITDIQYQFPAGAAIIKLLPPVTYNVTSDHRLVRIEGNRVTTAAFNVRSLSITETATSTGWSYALAVTLAAEGYETGSATSDETRATVEYTSVPRSLNLAANQLN